MSVEGPENTTKHQNDENAEGAQKRRGNGVLRVGGKIGRGIAKVSAGDVLARDIKRIRPRFPNLWQDIISGSWRSGSDGTTVRPASVSLLVSIICGLLTAVFAIYAYTVVLAPSAEGPVSLSVFIGCALVVFAGLVQTAAYGAIAYTQKTRSKTNSEKTRRPKATQSRSPKK